MLSIDEMIAKHRKIAKTQKALYDACTLKEQNKHFLREAEEHEHLAEWLEELKIYQQHEIICNKGYNAGYNKAIDDFAESVKNLIADSSVVRFKDIDEIANHLRSVIK